eukprot:540885_1
MSSTSFTLERGAVQRMLANDRTVKPILQVLDVKKIVTGSSGERYRLVLSDSQNYIQGMLATQATHLVRNNKITKFTVIHLQDFVCNNISGKKICVVVACDILGNPDHGIGKPTSVATNVSSASSSSSMNNNRPAPPSNQQPFHQRQQFNNNSNQNQNQNRNNYGGNNNNNNYGGNRGNGPNNGGGAGGYGGYNNKPAMFGNDMGIQPVSSLNPYQNNWKIKVRVTKKENIRHWHNQKGDGKLFGLELLDKDGTEIRGVCFNQAADKFYSMMQENKVYLISKGTVRLAKKGFSHITNDYSITLNEDAEVVEVDNNNEIQKQRYKFITIAEIENIEPKQFVDVLGVVTDIGPLSAIMSQKNGGKELKRRTIKITDKTATIDVTLWGQHAEHYDSNELKNDPVVTLKGAKVSHFGGRSLSANQVDVTPDMPEVHQLTAWYANNRGNIANGDNFKSLTTSSQGVNNNAPRRTLGEVKEMKLGENVSSKFEANKADYFTVVGTITHISHSPDRRPWYEANPDENSETAKNAKVEPLGDGKYRCEKNGKVYNGYVPRYILRFCCTDFTGNIWMT